METKSVSCALKFLLPKDSPDWYRLNELRVLQNIREKSGQHRHIVKYYGYFQLKIEDSSWVVLCMEKCAGSLHEFLDNEYFKNLTPEEQIAGCWDIVKQIATGLHLCHSWRPRLMHRDIKPQNSTDFISSSDFSLIYADEA